MTVPGLPIRILVMLVCMTSMYSSATAQETEPKITFDDHVKPIFQQRCAACHNGDRQSGGLNLTNFTVMMQGGSSGSVIEPGDASGSYLYLLVTHEESPEMPPGGSKIPDEEISRIEAWINAGALENSGSVARKKGGSLAAGTSSIGSRPETVTVPPRMSLEPSLHTSATGIVNSIAVHPWSAVAALAVPKQLLLYNTGNLKLVGTLPLPEGQANALHFSRSGQLLLAGGGRHGLAGKVVVWDVATAERVLELGDEPDNVLAADINADHSLVALGGPLKMLRVFSTADGQLQYEIKKHNDWLTAIEFSPDGVLLASADRSGGLQIWEAASGNEYLTLAGHDLGITDISWRPDGNVLASSGGDGAIRLWEMENGSQIKSWAAHANSVSAVQFTRSGKLVSTGRDSLAKIWEADGKHLRDFQGLQEIGVSLGYCDETGSLIAASLAGEVAVWKADDGTQRGNLNANPPTLEHRLNNATERLQAANGNLQPLEMQLGTVEESLAKLNADLSAQQTSLDQFRLQTETAITEIQTIEAQSATATAQREAWQQELDETYQAIPLVADASKKANQASSLLPQDQPLKNAAEELERRHQHLTARSTELTGSIEESKKSGEAQLNRIPELQSAIAEAESTMSATSRAIEQLNQDLAAVEKEKAELIEKISAARSEVEKFQAQSNGWRDELEFHQVLAARYQELTEANQQIDGKQAALQTAQTELETAQAEYARRLAEKENSEQAAGAIQEELRKLRTRK